MNKWIVWLLVPPIAFLFPWSLAMFGRRWVSAGVLLALWAAGWVLTLWVWSGVGIALLVALGLWVAFTGAVESRSPETAA